MECEVKLAELPDTSVSIHRQESRGVVSACKHDTKIMRYTCGRDHLSFAAGRWDWLNCVSGFPQHDGNPS